MTYLITGGAGFIGSALAHELVARGERVRVIDSLATGNRRNLEDLGDAIEFVEADICDLPAVERTMQGVDYVLHQAALPSVPRSVADPLSSHRTNADGTLNVLWAAKQAKVRRLVYAASSSAYGDTPTLPKVESMTPNPLSPYAVNKLLGEHYCRVFYLCYGLETVALRYFNIFGPRQDPGSPYSGVLSLFITKLLANEPVRIYGDGEQSRDFNFVANAVEANLLACTAPKAPGNVYNIGTGNRYTLNQTLATLAEIIGVKARAEYDPPRAGDVRDSQADITAARRDLGYTAPVGFEEGLRATVEWYRHQGK
jgi:nucleoside-diphosphate-sugar epimerase